MTFKQVFQLGKQTLKSNNVECYDSDALYLFEECFGLSRKDLIINGNLDAPEPEISLFLNMINKVISGIPVQYVTGKCRFMDINLNVGYGVLIPRDDTEILVRGIKNRINIFNNLSIIDLCSGSGAIAIALEKIFYNSNITAIEISKNAYRYLQENILLNKSNITAINQDIFKFYENIQNNSIDILASNPPYIPTKDLSSLSKFVKKEPEIALDGGELGMDFYYNICQKWTSKLKSGGLIAFEIGINQLENVCEILKSYGFKNITSDKDINNIPRAVFAIK